MRELKQAIDRLVILNNGQILRSNWWELPKRARRFLSAESNSSVQAPVSQAQPSKAAMGATPVIDTVVAPPHPIPAGEDISTYMLGAPPNRKDRYQHARKLLEQSDNDFAWVASRMGIHTTTLYRWRKRNKI